MKENTTLQNRLVGWLVSYQHDEKGFAYELRSGRSFVTKEKLANARFLAVQDDTVSSPHMAIKATVKHKVIVQDIFSDQGSFISRANGQESSINGPVELQHGDWLRIGKNSRYQVCLIDGPAN